MVLDFVGGRRRELRRDEDQEFLFSNPVELVTHAFLGDRQRKKDVGCDRGIVGERRRKLPVVRMDVDRGCEGGDRLSAERYLRCMMQIREYGNCGKNKN